MRVKRSDSNVSFDFCQRLLDVLLDVSFDAQLGSPATQNSFCHYGNPWRTGGNACISNMALPPNTLAPTTSRDRTRSQSIWLPATPFELSICGTRIFCATKASYAESRGRRAAKFAGKLTHDPPTWTPYPISVGVE